MENQSDSAAADESEEEPICDSFTCCVCLDLLHKPIVLPCGHVSCFWCIHKSKNSIRGSRCPFCRDPYSHIPTVCRMLHFLLLKMYPIAYNRRENQIIEDEKKWDYFSPQFDANPCGSHANKELSLLGDCDPAYSSTASESNSSSDHSKTVPEQTRIKVMKTEMPQDELNGTCKNISVADLLCPICKSMLFRPVVFNCGHVYCESCIINSANEMLRCQVCQSLHPKGLPKVYLELDQFLEQYFPEEYTLRRATVELLQVNSKHESPSKCSKEADKKRLRSQEPSEAQLSTWSDAHANVHFGVGCDTCGMYPIEGERYKCLDCEEAVGFDLCGECYNTGSKLPGRFNQRHTPEHKFELISSNTNTVRNLMVSLLSDSIQNGSMSSILPITVHASDTTDNAQDQNDTNPSS